MPPRTRILTPSDLVRRVPPNGVRLSRGALKKDSFHNLQRAASFKRLLDSAPTIPSRAKPTRYRKHIADAKIRQCLP